MGLSVKNKTKAELKAECDRLAKESGMLRSIVRDTMWMARRYADGRSSYAPSMFNRALDEALKLGIDIQTDVTMDGRTYANDGMFGSWDPDRQTFRMDKPKVEDNATR